MSLSVYSNEYRGMVINGTLKFRKQQMILSNIKDNKASLSRGERIVYFRNCILQTWRTRVMTYYYSKNYGEENT